MTTTTSPTKGGEEDEVHILQTLLTVREVFVYRIPPMKSSGGHRYVPYTFAILYRVGAAVWFLIPIVHSLLVCVPTIVVFKTLCITQMIEPKIGISRIL